MAPDPARVLPATLPVAESQLPLLRYMAVKKLRYGIVYWRGRRHLLGREDDPAHLQNYRIFRDCLRLTGQPPGPQDISPNRPFLMAELIASYLEHTRTYYRHAFDGSETASVVRIRTSVRPLLQKHAQLQARDFSIELLKAHREELIREDLCRVTINGKIQVIKQMFAWAAEEGLLPASVAANLKVFRQLKRNRSAARDPKARGPVADEHFQLTIPHLPGPLQALLLTMSHTGMRVGEAVQLCGALVDRTDSPWTFRPPRHKTLHHGKIREIAIGPQAQAILRPFLSLDPAKQWFSPQDAIEEQKERRRSARKTPLFPSHLRHISKQRRAQPLRAPREHYDGRSVAHAIHRAIDKANRLLIQQHASQPTSALALVPYWSTHQLRYASLSRIREQFGIEAALTIGGHGSLAVTEHYTEQARRSMARKVIAHVG